MAEGKPQLGYWKIRGLASSARYILHYADVDFEDVTYEVGPAPEWSRDSWFSVKPNLGIDFPNLPYFIDGDFKFSESGAIFKYICKKWAPALLGTTDKEYATAEQIVEFVHPLKREITMPSYTGGQWGADITCELLWTSCCDKLAVLDEFRNRKGYKWLAGDNITWVDFYFWEIVDYFVWLSNGAVFDKFPKLKEYHSQFLELPDVKKWWNDDVKAMKFPWNNASAKIGGRDSKINP